MKSSRLSPASRWLPAVLVMLAFGAIGGEAFGAVTITPKSQPHACTGGDPCPFYLDTKTGGLVLDASYVVYLIGGVAASFVQRGKHDIQTFEDLVVEVEAAVGKDVHFAAVKNGDLREPLAKSRDLVGLTLDAVNRKIAGCA